jgi:hypothetical protein
MAQVQKQRNAQRSSTSTSLTQSPSLKGAQRAPSKPSMEEMYNKKYLEINGCTPNGAPSQTSLDEMIIKDDLDAKKFKKAINVNHNVATSHLLTMSFNTSLEQLQSNPEASKWSAGGDFSKRAMAIGSSYGKEVVSSSMDLKNGKFNEPSPFGNAINSGDFVQDIDGQVYRLVLSKATITSVANSTPLEIGVKIEGIPAFHGDEKTISRHTNDFDFILSPDTKTPYTVNHVIYKNNVWDEAKIESLSRDNMTHINHQMVQDSILEKTKEGYWVLHQNSPLLDQAYQDDTAHMIKTIPIQNTGEQIAMIGEEYGERLEKKVLERLSLLPFHNPYNVKSRIERTDGRNWTDPGIGIIVPSSSSKNAKTTDGTLQVGSSVTSGHELIHPILTDKAVLSNPENVRADVLLEYIYYRVPTN